jgi:hypothetical protein
VEVVEHSKVELHPKVANCNLRQMGERNQDLSLLISRDLNNIDQALTLEGYAIQSSLPSTETSLTTVSIFQFLPISWIPFTSYPLKGQLTGKQEQ